MLNTIAQGPVPEGVLCTVADSQVGKLVMDAIYGRHSTGSLM